MVSLQENGQKFGGSLTAIFSGMTKTKMSKGMEEDSSAAEFLERRRASLERYVRRTSQNPVLLQVSNFTDLAQELIDG